jgi:hypothetical protein
MLVRPAEPITSLPPAVPRPRALVDGTWAAARLDAGELGPSLLEVVMWFPLDETATERALGTRDRVTTVMMDRDAVRAVLPDAGLPAIGNAVEVTGDSYPASAFEGAGYFGARAIHIRGGLLVAVRSGG